MLTIKVEKKLCQNLIKLMKLTVNGLYTKQTKSLKYDIKELTFYLNYYYEFRF